MTRLRIAALALLLLWPDAGLAQEGVKVLKDLLQGLGNKVIEGVDRALNPTENLAREFAGATDIRGPLIGGVCYRYSKNGVQQARGNCIRAELCPPGSTCQHDYRWENRERTLIDLQDGKAALMDGAAVKIGPFKGHPCFQNQTTRAIFCFDETGPVALPQTASPDAGGLAEEGVPPVDPNGDVAGNQPLTVPGQDPSLATPSPPQNNGSLLTLGYDPQKPRDELVAFLNARNFDTLPPVAAPKMCLRVAQVAIRSDRAALEAFCQELMWDYARKESLGEADRQADAVLKTAASLAGLRSRSWFRLDQDRMRLIPRELHDETLVHYGDKVDGHFRKAVAAAIKEIQTAFAEAVPFQPSEDTALAYCPAGEVRPDAIEKTCAATISAFTKRKENARCERSILASGAPQWLLEAPFAVSPGMQMAGHALICQGVRNRPEFGIRYQGGGLLFWRPDRLQLVQDNGQVVVDMVIAQQRLRDDRSFFKYLVDIATGENERRQTTVMGVSRIDAIDRNFLPAAQPSNVLGCALRFVACRS